MSDADRMAEIKVLIGSFTNPVDTEGHMKWLLSRVKDLEEERDDWKRAWHVERGRHAETRAGCHRLIARVEALEKVLGELPDRVATRLFAGAHGAEVNRLVQESEKRLDGPGWCKQAVADQVRSAALAAMEATQ